MSVAMNVSMRALPVSGLSARWPLAFAAVALVHAGLMALLFAPASERDLRANAGSPFVVDMLLPAAPEPAVSAPDPVPQAPAPVPETPAPPETPVEPVTEPEVVEPETPRTPQSPPEPAPSTPEQSTAQTEPGASSAPGVPDARIREQQLNWQTRLLMHLERAKRYPLAARQRNEQGIALVKLSMDRGGRVLSAAVVRSSGSRWLDEEAVALMRRAQPLPAPPDALPGESLSLKVPVRFSLR